MLFSSDYKIVFTHYRMEKKGSSRSLLSVNLVAKNGLVLKLKSCREELNQLVELIVLRKVVDQNRDEERKIIVALNELILSQGDEVCYH